MTTSKKVKILIEETNVNYYGWAMIADAFVFLPIIKKYLGIGFTLGLMEMKRESGRYGFDIENWNAMGQACLKKLQTGKLSLNKLSQEHKKLGKKIKKLCHKIEKCEIPKISLNQIKIWLNNLWQPYLELNALGFIPVVSDYDHNYLTKKLISILRLRDVSEKEIQNTLNILITHSNLTLFLQEQKDLLEIVSKHKTLNNTNKSLELFRHIEQYKWLHYGYQGPLLKANDFLPRLKQIFSSSKSLKHQLLEHKSFLSKLKANQKKLSKKLKLSTKEKTLFKAARQFSYLKTYRVEVRHNFSYISDLLFTDLSRRFRLHPKFFHYCTRVETMKVLNGKKINKKAVLQRMQYFVEIISPKGRRFYTKSQAKSILNKLVQKEKIINTEELNGQAAFLGKTIGKVKLVFSAKDINKVQHGDILVSISTNPDFLPAMYRANAFITDHGGITSHAAIVAREMKKPCIIGTKIATKVLKDGDLVEVDATKGIVKKL